MEEIPLEWKFIVKLTKYELHNLLYGKLYRLIAIFFYFTATTCYFTEHVTSQKLIELQFRVSVLQLSYACVKGEEGSKLKRINYY